MFRLEKVLQNDDSAYILFTQLVKSAGIFLSFYIFSILENNSIYEETFLLDAIQSNTSIISSNKNIDNNTKKNIIKNNTIKLKHYTIQVASWPTLEQARKDQISLRENGYDAYIEQTTINKTNQIWYRVRIGNFKTKSTAMTVQSELKSFWENDTWIDRVKVK